MDLDTGSGNRGSTLADVNYFGLRHRAAAALRAISGRCTGSIDGAARTTG